MCKNKKGISLIVLMITIIVMLILVSVIVLTFSNNNPIKNANEAKFKSDLSGFREELLATHSEKEIADSDYDRESINIEVGKFQDMKKYIPDITEKYANKLLIKKGNLLYIGDDTSQYYSETEEEWAKDIGIQSPYKNIGDANGDGLITIEDAATIQYYFVNSLTSTLSTRQIKAFDYDRNGSIESLDAVMLQQYLRQ